MYTTTDESGILNRHAKELKVCYAGVSSSPRRHDYLLYGASVLLSITFIGVVVVSIG